MALISLKGKDSTPMHIGCISPSTPCISDDIIPYPMHIRCISPLTLCISGDIILYPLHIRIEVLSHSGVNMIPTPALFNTLSLLNGGFFRDTLMKYLLFIQVDLFVCSRMNLAESVYWIFELLISRGEWAYIR